MKKILLLGVAASSLSGCKQLENTINELMNHGTAYGIQRCYEINKTEVASGEATKMSCIAAIATEMPGEDLEATARIDGQNPLEFWVRVDNNSNEYILTHADISVHFFINNGQSKSINQVAYFGIQPRDWGGETVYFRGAGREIDEVSFCGDGEKNDCITWSMEPFGVTVR